MVEMLVAVVIPPLLVAGIFSVSNKISVGTKTSLAQGTIALLDSAAEQYYDYWKSYPPDCNSCLDAAAVAAELETRLGFSSVSIAPATPFDPNYASSPALYFALNRTPPCKAILAKIDNSLLSNKNANDIDMTITADGKDYPYTRIIDPWKTAIKYSFPNNDANNFPKIESAGPDMLFRTADDIVNRKN